MNEISHREIWSEKSAVRKKAKQRRDALTAQQRADKGLSLDNNIKSLQQFRDASSVLLYASFGSEVSTLKLIEYCISAGIQTCLPKISPEINALRIYRIASLAELKPGCWGIPEPAENDERQLDTIDFVAVPGVAFDEACNRIGYGKGYYDRLLASIDPMAAKRPFMAGLAFEEQLFPSLYCEPYDIKMDAVITDRRIIYNHGS